MAESHCKSCHPHRGGSEFSFTIDESQSLLPSALWSHCPCAQWAENILPNQIGPECFPLCLPRTLWARGTEKDGSWLSPSHWFLCFRDPSKKGMCCGGKDWSIKQVVQIPDIPFWHPFKINKWNTRSWEWIAIGMLMFSQRFGKLVH